MTKPVPKYVGLAEIGGILGVTCVRAFQLARDYEDFPDPVVSLSMGRIWDREEIKEWKKQGTWNRKRGPKKKVKSETTESVLTK